jgi:hypothetical protein
MGHNLSTTSSTDISTLRLSKQGLLFANSGHDNMVLRAKLVRFLYALVEVSLETQLSLCL